MISREEHVAGTCRLPGMTDQARRQGRGRSGSHKGLGTRILREGLIGCLTDFGRRIESCSRHHIADHGTPCVCKRMKCSRVAVACLRILASDRLAEAPGVARPSNPFSIPGCRLLPLWSTSVPMQMSYRVYVITNHGTSEGVHR